MVSLSAVSPARRKVSFGRIKGTVCDKQTEIKLRKPMSMILHFSNLNVD